MTFLVLYSNDYTAPVNALRPDGLCALNNSPLVANHCIKHSKPFVIPIIINSLQSFIFKTKKYCPKPALSRKGILSSLENIPKIQNFYNGNVFVS